MYPITSPKLPSIIFPSHGFLKSGRGNGRTQTINCFSYQWDRKENSGSLYGIQTKSTGDSQLFHEVVSFSKQPVFVLSRHSPPPAHILPQALTGNQGRWRATSLPKDLKTSGLAYFPSKYTVLFCESKARHILMNTTSREPEHTQNGVGHSL